MTSARTHQCWEVADRRQRAIAAIGGAVTRCMRVRSDDRVEEDRELVGSTSGTAVENPRIIYTAGRTQARDRVVWAGGSLRTPHGPAQRQG